MGVARLVERLRMSFPCTTMLSVDFLRSRVSISTSSLAEPCRSGECVPTVTAGIQVDHTADADVDDPEETLILFLELLLVKDLNGQNAFLGDSPSIAISMMFSGAKLGPAMAYMSKLSFQ